MKQGMVWLICWLLLGGLSRPEPTLQSPLSHLVRPGDSWVTLAWAYQNQVSDWQTANPHPNPLRRPVIGDFITIPAGAAPNPRNGLLVRPVGGVLELAARYGQNPWQLATQNGLATPFQPAFYRPIFIPVGDQPPQELPAGFNSLELSSLPALPGRVLAYRATVSNVLSTTTKLNLIPFNTFINGSHLVGLGGTGAFFPAGTAELLITPAGQPGWSQPLRFVADEWDYDRVTLTGDAAAIDQEAITAERDRLRQIWNQASPMPQWTAAFQLPLNDYLAISSNYGARRSYNGGPFNSYHEGVDFSAYGGTPVYAPAGGNVVIAETLYVRGGAVIINHGWGLYSGYYHLSAVLAQVGDVVRPGQLIGEVGTTGFSSGNHLHWDMLAAGIWVNALAWQEQELACWLLEGWGQSCSPNHS